MAVTNHVATGRGGGDGGTATIGTGTVVADAITPDSSNDVTRIATASDATDLLVHAPSGTPEDCTWHELLIYTPLEVTFTKDSRIINTEVLFPTTSKPGGEVAVGLQYNAELDVWHVRAVTDDAEAPEIDWTSASQSGAEDDGPFTITAQLSRATLRDVVAPYTVTGTAVPDEDYDALEGELTIPAGDTTKDIEVDVIAGGGGTVILTLDTPQNATIGDTDQHTLTISVVHALVQAWLTNIQAAGGSTPSDPAITVVNTLIQGLDDDGVLAKMAWLWLRGATGGNWASAKVMMKFAGTFNAGTGVGCLNSVGTGTAYTDGDYTRTAGILGKTNEALKFGLLGNTLSTNDNHLSVGNLAANGVGILDYGAASAIIHTRLASTNGNTCYFDSYGGGPGRVTFMTTGLVPDRIIGTRRSSTDQEVYRNGVSKVSSATANASSPPTTELYIHGFNSNGTLANSGTTGKLTLFSAGAGLSAGLVAAYEGRWATFESAMTALG